MCQLRGDTLKMSETLSASEVIEDRGPKWILGGSDRTQGQPSHISRKLYIARTDNTKPGVQYRDRCNIYTQVHATTNLTMNSDHVHM